MGIPERLKETRELLGHTQAALAELVGSTKRSVINWEGGVSFPGANVLAQYAAVGADVLYILTGHRGQPQTTEATPPPDERVLLESYRRCDIKARQHLIATAALLSAGLPGDEQGGTASVGGTYSQHSTGKGAIQIGKITNKKG